MKLRLVLRVILLFTLFNSGDLLATTIVPFDDYQEVIENADAIILCRASSLVRKNHNGVGMDVQNFKILEYLKGYTELPISFTSNIVYPNGFKLNSPLDKTFTEGDTYVLFLKIKNDKVEPLLSHYYELKEIQINKTEYLIPAHHNSSFNLKKNTSHQHSFYNKKNWIDQVKEVVLRNKSWNEKKVELSKEEFLNISKTLKDLPSHCSLLSNDAVWANASTNPINVYYTTPPSSCSNINTRIQNAIDILEDNYTGVSINLGGQVNNFSTDCVNQNFPGSSTAIGNPYFIDYLDNNIGRRVILIIFEDPCNEIPDITSCTGNTILGYGGNYALSNTISGPDGETFSEATAGFVVVNNGAVDCICNSSKPFNNYNDLELVLAHEMTHALGFDHITDDFVSNMNASCCNDITNFDKECIDYIYPPSEGCKITNAHNYDPSALTADNSLCETCSDNILNGDEIAVDCGGALCQPCTTGCTISTAHNYSPNADISDNSTCETCSDNIRNGDETAVDCGGVRCQPCTTGCTISTAHNYSPNADISDNSTCETCFDNIRNGDETAVDCGGVRCQPCTTGCTISTAHNYSPNADISDNSTCETCFDNIRNGDETAVDCGGARCQPCTTGCTISTAHNYSPNADISDNSTCETCFDNIRNGDETAVDCGGARCQPCTTGCTISTAHNYSPNADISDNSTCETCSDNIRNGDETAVDCGGARCQPCTTGCTISTAHNYSPNADISDNSTCETCSDNIRNGDETAVDCGGVRCQPCTTGCTISTAHNYSSSADISDNSTCETCSDNIRNGDETAVDCGGVRCQPCTGSSDCEFTNRTLSTISANTTYGDADTLHISALINGNNTSYEASQMINIYYPFEIQDNMMADFSIEPCSN